jgi:rSAM-associated Gly-rich repeat protein
MSASNRMFKALAALLPLGALGISTALASVPARPATAVQTADAAQRGVAERLQSIRGAVSDAVAEGDVQPGDPDVQKAQWLNWLPSWRNGGWNNWRNGWGNGGWNNWGNGWHNGGWRNW